MEVMTDVLQKDHPVLDKVVDERERLKVVMQFMRWLREEKNLEICQLTHTSGAREKVYVKTPAKIEWLIAEFFDVDLRKLDTELKRYDRLGFFTALTGDDVIRMHGEKMMEQLNQFSSAIRKKTEEE